MSPRRIDDELLALYALDALEGPERDEVEAAVARSPRLARELERHREVAAAMADAFSAEPPPELKARVLAAAFAEQAPREIVPTDAPSVVVPLGSARSRRRLMPLVAVGLAVAAAVGIGVVLARRTDHAPAVASAVLVGEGPATIDAQVSSSGRLTLTGRDVPTIDAAHTYQLWMIDRDQQVRSAGLFAPSTDGSVTAEFTVDLSDASTLAVTLEPAGGSKVATGQIEFSGPLD